VVKEGTLRVQAINSPSGFEVTTDATGVVGHAGAALLRELADRVGLTAALGWCDPQGRRQYRDAAVLRDLAVMLADGGDCLSDLAVLRDQPALFGPVASTPTAWRVVERVASDPDGLARLRAARAHARGRVWAAGGDPHVELLVIDADATLVTAHSDHKEGAAGTYKGSFGFAPLLAYLDRGQAPGEPLAGPLRSGNAAPGASSDLIELVDLALAQLPRSATDQPVLVRSDSAGAAASWPGTYATAASGSAWGCRSTPTCARRSQPNPNTPGRPRWRPTARSATARGGRADRLHRPAHLAAGHPGDLPPRGRPPRRPAALHRPRRPPLPGLPHRPARP
jgi:hypothetical protein